MWESGACIHIGLFRSERIVGQERLFCTAGYSAKGKKKKQQCLLCGSVEVTASGESIAIFGDILIDGRRSIHVQKWAGTSTLSFFHPGSLTVKQ